MNEKILHWFATREVGSSSKAMASCISGINGGEDHPLDPDDFNRCLLFLTVVPEARNHLHKVKKLSPVWSRFIDRWEEIEKLFLDEVGLDWCNGNSAPKTYKLMQQIIAGGLGRTDNP